MYQLHASAETYKRKCLLLHHHQSFYYLLAVQLYLWR